MVVPMASPSFFPCMDVAEAVGVCCCHMVGCVAGLGFNRVKAFTYIPVSGNGDSALDRRFLVGGTVMELLPRYTRSSGVKTLPFGASDGGATRAAPLLETSSLETCIGL
jgi:hypothetical protein